MKTTMTEDAAFVKDLGAQGAAFATQLARVPAFLAQAERRAAAGEEKARGLLQSLGMAQAEAEALRAQVRMLADERGGLQAQLAEASKRLAEAVQARNEPAYEQAERERDLSGGSQYGRRPRF
jgi:septal ring factor EnvC (AmiA/AmiB activator)